MTTHIVIPDLQVKPGIDPSYLSWIGKYIAHKEPDVIVNLGDMADMPSLSSYDKGKKSAEGRRVMDDIKAVKSGMAFLEEPMKRKQRRQRQQKVKVWEPRKVITLGNHEERLDRHIEANPELDGFLGDDPWGYRDRGWEVYDYLQPVVIDGVTYAHFMANPFTGKPYGGTAQNILKNVGDSFIQGHKQTLDIATRFLPASGRQQWGIVAGACYTHDEAYKGPQGNYHYRGLLLLHSVANGSFGLTTVSLDYLEKKYGG